MSHIETGLPLDNDPGQTTNPSDPRSMQYSLGSLLTLVLLVSLLAAGVRSCYWMEGHGDLLFWLVLLAPLGGPLLFGGTRLRTRSTWSVVHLLPISWYLCLVRLDPWSLPARAIVAVITAVACVLLVVGYRGWWHALTIPLWIAMVTGTVWTVFFWP